MFRSMARVYGPGAVGVVLSGYLDDGTAGLLAIKDCGGVAIVQDPVEAGVASMPASALSRVRVDRCCTVDDMGPLLAALACDEPPRATPLQGLRQIEFEDRIAEHGVRPEDWEALADLSSPTARPCPECGRMLHQLHDARVTRYRCEAGHAFTIIEPSSGTQTQLAID
jgi:two-component system chemotaxis response regulator CheB